MNKTAFYIFLMWYLLMANTTFAFSRADTLRGSNGIGRYWWDVGHYNLQVNFDVEQKSISGYNTITLAITASPHDSMQIDLQEPMVLDSVILGGQHIPYVREGNVWWLTHPFHTWNTGDEKTITIYYHGIPRVAVRAPWDGGVIWKKDTAGNPWVTVACQGLGASVWWPCKDIQSDEPETGMDMYYGVPNTLQCVSNGRFIDKKEYNNNTLWHWQVKNPINNYDVSFYIGDYVHWSDTLAGEKGKLDLDYYVLRQNLEKAQKQFAIVKPMLHCYEYWMGPYPFYEDGYKLVETPYLGMEHQSAIAYGNKYRMGYLGMDRSHTGYGLLFDYIIVHESGHEWFGNNVTAKDINDNWIHEGFTTYTEALFVECMFGKDKAAAYNIGEREGISNDVPMIGTYGVQDERMGDIYPKGATVVYMLRKLINDDERFRQMLREINSQFYHKTVTSKEVEDYIETYLAGVRSPLKDIIQEADGSWNYPIRPFFNQYLRQAQLPTFEYYIKKKRLYYRFTHTVPEFTVPIAILSKRNTIATLFPTTEWNDTPWNSKTLQFANDFLIRKQELH